MKKLFEDFEGISDKEYLDKLKTDLKGQAVEDLSWLDENNLKHRPYYRKSDLKKLLQLEDLQKANKVNYSWKISSSYHIDNENLSTIDKPIKSSLKNGAEIIVLHSHLLSNKLDKFLSDKKLPKDSIIVENSLNNFNFDAKHNYAYFLDPFKDALLSGQKFESSNLEQLIQNFKKKDITCNLMVDANIYKNAGANQVQEITFALQHVLEYLDVLSDQQLDLEYIVSKMHIKMGMGNSLFPELAKIRVFRYLLNKLFSAYGISAKASMVGEICEYQLSVTDPYNNLLRECTQLMAGALTSCRFIICPSFDLSKDPNLEFGIRMSRNLQHLLKEEAYISKVSDPSAGSYYIESLSADFAEAAWEKFLKIEDNGGLNKLYEKGELQKEIEDVHQHRLKNLIDGKQKIVGLNIHQPEGLTDKDLLGNTEKSIKSPYTALEKRNLSLAYLKYISKSKNEA